MSPANLRVCGVRALALLAVLTATTAAKAQGHFIQSASNSLYLDANPRTQGNGAQVYLWEFNGGPAQRWRLRPAN
jgi:hypothetical protein